MSNQDLYSKITDAIIAELEQGIIPWKKPWTGTVDGPISHATGKPYSFLNQLLLRRPGEYLTFHQVQQEGGRVNKGAKGTTVYFWKLIQKDADGNIIHNALEYLAAKNKGDITTIPVLKSFVVFHISDTTGIKPKHGTVIKDAGLKPDAKAEAILTDYLTREHIKFTASLSNKAYYSPSFDEIQVPAMKQFAALSEYYSTAFHETVHSTGHPSRLHRFETGSATAAFGTATYSKEELVAEIGSAFLCNRTGLETPASFKNSAAYIRGYLEALKNDKSLIVSAASKAEKAVKLILNEQMNESEQGAE